MHERGAPLDKETERARAVELTDRDACHRHPPGGVRGRRAAGLEPAPLGSACVVPAVLLRRSSVEAIECRLARAAREGDERHRQRRRDVPHAR